MRAIGEGLGSVSAGRAERGVDGTGEPYPLEPDEPTAVRVTKWTPSSPSSENPSAAPGLRLVGNTVQLSHQRRAVSSGMDAIYLAENPYRTRWRSTASTPAVVPRFRRRNVSPLTVALGGEEINAGIFPLAGPLAVNACSPDCSKPEDQFLPPNERRLEPVSLRRGIRVRAGPTVAVPVRAGARTFGGRR